MEKYLHSLSWPRSLIFFLCRLGNGTAKVFLLLWGLKAWWTRYSLLTVEAPLPASIYCSILEMRGSCGQSNLCWKLWRFLCSNFLATSLIVVGIGVMNWEDAEMKLKGKPDGSFLVRDSSILVISWASVSSQGITHHTRMEHYRGERCWHLKEAAFPFGFFYLWYLTFSLEWSTEMEMWVGRKISSLNWILIYGHWISINEILVEMVRAHVPLKAFSASCLLNRVWRRLLKNRIKPVTPLHSRKK